MVFDNVQVQHNKQSNARRFTMWGVHPPPLLCWVEDVIWTVALLHYTTTRNWALEFVARVL